MLPQPGSAAICAGTLANATAAGISADQRGLGFDPNCPAGVVDSGAVQSHYALNFRVAPPTSAIVGSPLVPSPEVQLTENGAAANMPTSPIVMSDTDSVLGGTTSVPLYLSAATFTNLVYPSSVSGDTLTATLSLNPALTPPLNLSLTSAPIGAYTGAALTSPTPGSTLATTSVTFTWSEAAGATGYQFWLGTQGRGTSDLYSSGPVNSTSFLSAIVNKIPSSGGTLYARLYTEFNGTWVHTDYTFTAPVLAAAAMTAPAPTSTLNGPSPTFTWSAGTGATGYQLWLGSTLGGNDLYSPSAVLGTSVLSATPLSLPTDGRTVYARLYTDFSGVWTHSDYTFTAATQINGALTSPTPGSALGGPSVTFTWSAGAGATGYELWIGSNGVNSNNLYSSGEVLSTSFLSVTASNLPTDGRMLYVRLYTDFNGTWRHTDYTYTAGSMPAITSPAPGSTLTGSSATFTWSAGTGVTAYQLWLGSSFGNDNLYFSPVGTETSVNVANLPVNGSTIYARLWVEINGHWNHIDYTYTAYLPN
jgi:hypothetical protein